MVHEISPDEERKNDDRLSVLHKIEDKYDYSCITFPASYEDIEKFEEINKVCIFIYTIEQEGIITDKKGNGNYIMNDCIYLLRIENQEQSHYVYIKHIDRLFNLHHHIQDKDKRFCPICTNKVNISEYGSHVSQCYKFAKNSTLLELSPGEMKFTKHKNKLERPFIVYADLEGTLIKIVDIEKLAMHKANSACFYFVCTFDNSRNRLWYNIGEDCVYQMIIELNKLAEECIAEMKENKRMIMTPEDEKLFLNSEYCLIFNKRLGFECEKAPYKGKAGCKVRDHDHRTGKYRGAAHLSCNINYFNNRYLPIVFHNLRGYDSHMIIKEAYKINKTLKNKKK